MLPSKSSAVRHGRAGCGQHEFGLTAGTPPTGHCLGLPPAAGATVGGTASFSVAATHDELHEAAGPLEGGRSLFQAVCPLLRRPGLSQLVDFDAHLGQRGRGTAARSSLELPSSSGSSRVPLTWASKRGWRWPGPLGGSAGFALRAQRASAGTAAGAMEHRAGSPRPAAVPRRHCTCRIPTRRCPGSWRTPGRGMVGGGYLPGIEAQGPAGRPEAREATRPCSVVMGTARCSA